MAAAADLGWQSAMKWRRGGCGIWRGGNRGSGWRRQPAASAVGAAIMLAAWPVGCGSQLSMRGNQLLSWLASWQRNINRKLAWQPRQWRNGGWHGENESENQRIGAVCCRR